MGEFASVSDSWDWVPQQPLDPAPTLGSDHLAVPVPFPLRGSALSHDTKVPLALEMVDRLAALASFVPKLCPMWT